MTNIRRLLVATGLVAVMGAATLGIATAQDKMARPPEATIYRDLGFQGPAVFVGEAKPNLGLAWPVNSIRIASGTWQLCERPNYRGSCRTVSRDTAMLGNIRRGLTIQSMRPAGGGWGGGDPVANDQTVRGNFAQFHTQPSMNGYRVRACYSSSANSACAARSADDFCRSTGWNGSAREHMETVGNRVYLADVLCVRSNY